MRAAVLSEINKPLIIINGIDLPELSRGQVLVKVKYSGVCHSQLMEARGGRGEDKYLPHLLGHEGTGTVVEVGPDVSKVRPGDHVVLTWIKGTGIDSGGMKYTFDGTVLNSGAITTFNNMAVISENRLVPLPDGVPMDVGVLFGCALLTGAGIILNSVHPRAGSTVAIFGLGGVGLSALIATRLFPVKELIAVDVEDEKLQLAREFGATQVINASKVDPVSAIRALTAGEGVDYSVESAGLVKTIEQAYQAVKKLGGKCTFASHPKSGERISIDPYDLICGKQLEGSWGGSANPDRDIPTIAQLYVRSRLPLEKLISKRYRLDEINEALNDLEQRRVIRPIIEMDHQS
jgi:S-(hydroxymethyl)glutathione dehydrogenase/alcohol dehydrogenase